MIITFLKFFFWIALILWTALMLEEVFFPLTFSVLFWCTRRSEQANQRGWEHLYSYHQSRVYCTCWGFQGIVLSSLQADSFFSLSFDSIKTRDCDQRSERLHVWFGSLRNCKNWERSTKLTKYRISPVGFKISYCLVQFC